MSETAAGTGTAFLLTLAHRYTRSAANRSLQQLDIDVRHLAVLAHLAESGPASQRELVDALHMDKSSMVYVVDELERQGLAERQRSPADRRSYAVRVTAAGEERLGAARRSAAAVMDDLLAPFTPAERERLDDMLARLVEHARRQG
jgi:DNA-binding MarR family transcriptional regulator